jgi:hypothetical protein
VKWYNLPIPLLQSDLFAEAEPWEIGVWLRLMVYCCHQENGGSILGCADWSERKWLLSAGVERSDLMKGSRLWTWAEAKPGVLWVAHYPGSREEEIRNLRAAGRKGGAVKSEKKVTASILNGKKGGRPRKPKQNPTEYKGKERKVIPVSFDDPDLEPEPDSEMR